MTALIGGLEDGGWGGGRGGGERLFFFEFKSAKFGLP